MTTRKFKILLIINNKRKDAKEFPSRFSAQVAASVVEGENLFWIGNKAYGKVNSYRIAVVEVV
jgi:hypothetical protein